jgi:putative DNA primase/helicase
MNVVESNIRIVGQGHDEVGQRYIKFRIEGSERRVEPFLASKIIEKPTSLFVALTNAGGNIFTDGARRQLLDQLQKRKAEADTFKVVTKLGWVGQAAYAFPDAIFGKGRLPIRSVFHDLDAQMLAKYRVRGTLKEWQKKIGTACAGNSRLMFAVSMAFAGPILSLVGGPRSGGFQITGAAETGKTTAAMAAGSVWGCHASGGSDKGFAESWHSTAGKLEITALAHNDGLLILDETKRAGRNDQGRAQAVIDMSLALAEQTEKQRLTNAVSARTWRLYFLSTSNYSLAELAARGGADVDDAELGRLFDVPCPNGPHGIYERLRGFASGEKLTDALKVRCRRYFGTPSRVFVRKLVAQRAKSSTALKAFLAGERQAYRDALQAKVKSEGLRPLGRVSGRCATVFVAGSLAIRYGILPWRRNDLLRAVLSCQVDGAHAATMAGPQKPVSSNALRQKLVSYLREKHETFMDLDAGRPEKGSHQLGRASGYRATFKGKQWFYLTVGQLGAIIGTDADAKKLKRRLIADSLMASQRGFVTQRPIFSSDKANNNLAWVCAFKAAILD